MNRIITTTLSAGLIVVSFLQNADAFRPSVHPNDVPPLVSTKHFSLLVPPPTTIDAASMISSTTTTRNGKSNSISSTSTSSTSSAPVHKVLLKPISTLTVGRKKWGVDKDHANEYWFDDRIHVFGNSGFWGAVHAAVAPLSTHLIDVAAYNGVDIRQRLAAELSERVKTKKGARVVDLCCGTGFSTRALHHAFPDAEAVIGVDTSAEMIAMAEFLTKHLATVKPAFDSAASQITEQFKALKAKRAGSKQDFKAVGFTQSNAEDTKLPAKSFDLVTVMWAFHEAPMQGRDRIIQEARRLLSPGGTLAVIDIAADYVPSEEMLKGEPYVQEYQQNIHRQLHQYKGFYRAEYKTIVPKHLGMWTLTRSSAVMA